MSFIKNFQITKDRGLLLKNTDERDKYLKGKIEHFSDFKNYNDKEEMLDLLQETIDMINYDISTAQFDISDVCSLGGFDFENNKEQMIIYYDLAIMLGAVFYNVFDCKGNRLILVKEGSTVPFKTTDMFTAGYNEFLYSKLYSIQHAFGATLIFTTLLERDLKTRIKNLYMEDLLEKLSIEIKSGNIILDFDDNDLYMHLRFHYELDNYNRASKGYDNHRASNNLAHDLFDRKGIVTTDKKFFEGIFGVHTLTLNNLITETKFKDKIDARFLEIIDIMFNPKKMNLRNNLAHGNTGYQNYFNINVTALIYEIYLMVLNDMFMKKLIKIS